MEEKSEAVDAQEMTKCFLRVRGACYSQSSPKLEKQTLALIAIVWIIVQFSYWIFCNKIQEQLFVCFHFTV